VPVDDVIVELGLGKVEPDAAQVRADVRLPSDLPPARQPQPPQATPVPNRSASISPAA
jgi:hypothetical protein